MTPPHKLPKILPLGVGTAIAAAVLFGASTPFAKVLVGTIPAILLAGLLYLGSGFGLWIFFLVRRHSSETKLTRNDVPYLAGAVVFGGALGPVLLMIGLRATPASSAALLLNLEGVFTVLLAWFVFRENFDTRIAIGMAAIVAGGIALSWQPGTGFTIPIASLAVVGACLCWAIDNNVTQKVSGSDPVQIAAIKGSVAGTVNLAIALGLGASLPPLRELTSALAVGFVGYGISLACFVVALRYIGTARTGAYFSLAPFVGAAVSVVVLHDRVRPNLLLAAGLMAFGVWLHLTERHEHRHRHERLVHSHTHVHDEHQQHTHEPGTDVSEPHTHRHVHEALTHSHAHYPDIHHRHAHE